MSSARWEPNLTPTNISTGFFLPRFFEFVCPEMKRTLSRTACVRHEPSVRHDDAAAFSDAAEELHRLRNTWVTHESWLRSYPTLGQMLRAAAAVDAPPSSNVPDEPTPCAPSTPSNNKRKRTLSASPTVLDHDSRTPRDVEYTATDDQLMQELNRMEADIHWKAESFRYAFPHCCQLLHDRLEAYRERSESAHLLHPCKLFC